MSSGAEDDVYKHQNCNNATEIVDGPPLLRNSKRTPNSADQFSESHQAEYEARGKRSTDEMEQVHSYNATYPKMKDELDKRQSMTKVTAITSRRGTHGDRVCSVCLKLKRNTKISTLNPRRQVKRKYRNKSRATGLKSRSNKRTNYKKKNYRYISRSCQCGTPATFKNTGSVQSFKPFNLRICLKQANLNVLDTETGNNKEKANDTDNKSNESSRTKRSIPINEKKTRSNVWSLEYPSTTEPSLNSYHSFLSMDKEPMDY